MKHTIVLLLCIVTITLGGCTSPKEEPPTTAHSTEPRTTEIEKQSSETTYSESTESIEQASGSKPIVLPTEPSSSTSVEPVIETSAPKPTEPSAETTSLISEENDTMPEFSSPQIPLDDSVYIGEYLDSVILEPNLEIAKREDGSFIVQISIYRLASFSDGIGELTADGILFTATDPSGNPIRGVITIEEQTAIVTFTESTWDYISNGSVYQYTKSSDTPTIWSDPS